MQAKCVSYDRYLCRPCRQNVFLMSFLRSLSRNCFNLTSPSFCPERGYLLSSSIRSPQPIEFQILPFLQRCVLFITFFKFCSIVPVCVPGNSKTFFFQVISALFRWKQWTKNAPSVMRRFLRQMSSWFISTPTQNQSFSSVQFATRNTVGKMH